LARNSIVAGSGLVRPSVDQRASMGGASSPRCTAVEHWARQAAGPTPMMLIQHAGPLLLRRPNESPTGYATGHGPRPLHRGGICAAEVVHRAAVSSDPAALDRDSRVTSEVKKESGGVRVLPVVAADRNGHRLGSALGGQHVFALLRRQSAPDAVGLGHGQRMVAAGGDHRAAVAHGFGVSLAAPPVLTPFKGRVKEHAELHAPARTAGLPLLVLLAGPGKATVIRHQVTTFSMHRSRQAPTRWFGVFARSCEVSAPHGAHQTRMFTRVLVRDGRQPMVDAVNDVPGTRSLGAVMGELARTLHGSSVTGPAVTSRGSLGDYVSSVGGAGCVVFQEYRSAWAR